MGILFYYNFFFYMVFNNWPFNCNNTLFIIVKLSNCSTYNFIWNFFRWSLNVHSQFIHCRYEDCSDICTLLSRTLHMTPFQTIQANLQILFINWTVKAKSFIWNLNIYIKTNFRLKWKQIRKNPFTI